MKDLYNENHKTLMKDTEDTNGKIPHVQGPEELKLLKCPHNPQPSAEATKRPSKPQWFPPRDRKNNPKICVESQKTPKSQSNTRKNHNSKARDITLPDLTRHDQLQESEQQGAGRKRETSRLVQSPEIGPHRHSRLMLDEGAENARWGRESLQDTLLGTLGY